MLKVCYYFLTLSFFRPSLVQVYYWEVPLKGSLIKSHLWWMIWVYAKVDTKAEMYLMISFEEEQKVPPNRYPMCCSCSESWFRKKWKTLSCSSHFPGISLGNMVSIRVALGLLSGEKPTLGCRDNTKGVDGAEQPYCHYSWEEYSAQRE